MQQDERSMLALVWTLNVYIEHTYDIVDMLTLVVHPQKSDYHPIRHNNVKVEMYLECQHESIGRNRIRLDV